MTRWWTLSFALICPLHLTVRTAIESDDEPEEANVSGTCAVICRRVPPHTDGRINQGRYFLQAEDARKVTWKVQDRTKFTIHSSSECLDKDLIMDAEVVPWVDRDDPINGSTMEIFVDPAVALKKLRRQSAAYVCAADGVADQRECFCEVETAGEQRYDGILNFLMRPLHGFSSVVEVLLAVDRRCPATWIPDALIIFLLLLLGSLLVFCIEAALAARKEREHEDLTQADGPGKDVAVVAAPLSSLKTGLTSAMGFVTTILTMQTFAVAKIVKDDTPERLVWFLIGLAFVLSAVGAYRIFQVVSKVQLVQASLARNLCIYGTPRSSWLDAALFAGVLLYAALVTLVVELFASAWSIAAVIGAAILVISAMVGPIISLFKVLQTTTQTEMDGEQMKLKSARLAELRKDSASASIQEGWTFVHWTDLVKAGREGEESALSSSFSSDSELSAQVDGELKVLDALWQRRTVKRTTGSYAGFLVLPCLAFTLLVAVSAAAMHVLIYSCSSGELEALYMAGVDDAMTFKASQDRYVVMLDSSFQQIILEAVGTEYLAREIIFHPGKKTNSSARSGDSANALIELHSMKIPRTVDVAVSGLRRSLNSTNYSIRFAPKQLLPQKLLIVSEDHSFQRCIPFSTLPGSRLSIPTDVSKVQVSVFFTDYVVGVPLEHGRPASGIESTWTAFAPHNRSSCTELCHGSPHCLHAFEGQVGCFFAQHDYNVQAEHCDRISSANISYGTFKADLQGCLASSNSSICGSAAVKQHLADFGLIWPGWRGEAVADLGFSLVMNASWQDLPVLSQVVALRRGRPQVADVLVSITGHLKQNGTKDIPASGRVLENGDIVLVISRYDMTEMSLLEMIVVPVLPDEKFEVRWLQEEAENMDIRVEDLPIFGHCPESEILLQRYRACQNSGGTGDWNASVLRRTFSPDFQGVQIRFVIDLQSASTAESHLGWGKLRSHMITPEFVGVDAPFAWAAQQHGCDLLDEQLDLLASSMLSEPAHSADALCEIFQSCNKSSNASQRNPVCAMYEGSGILDLNGAFQRTSNVVKLMACFDKFCGARLEETSVGWKYHRGSLTTTQSAYSHDGKHLQKTWQLADLFDAAVHLDKDLLPNALDVLSGIGRRAVNETQAQQQVAAEWLKRAIEVGNLPLLEALEPALPQGFVSNGETSIADTLCKEVWKVASQHSDNDSWSVNWLKEVAHLGEKWTYGGLDKWTRCLIENGIQETAAPEVMEGFLQHMGASVSNIHALTLQLRSTAALDSVAKVLKYLPKLKGLELQCKGLTCDFRWHPEFVEAFAHLEHRLSLFGWTLGQAELKAMAKALPHHDSGVLHALQLSAPISAELFQPLTSICVEHYHLDNLWLQTPEDEMQVARDIRNASMPCLQSFVFNCCTRGCEAIEKAVNAKDATYQKLLRCSIQTSMHPQ